MLRKIYTIHQLFRAKAMKLSALMKDLRSLKKHVKSNKKNI